MAGTAGGARCATQGFDAVGGDRGALGETDNAQRGEVFGAVLGGDIVHLRVEGLLEPAAVISEPRPRFSFLHGDQPSATTGFGVTQASYRITVATVGDGDPRVKCARPRRTPARSM